MFDGTRERCASVLAAHRHSGFTANAKVAYHFLLDPRVALQLLLLRPTFLFPLSVIVLGTAVALGCYFFLVDFDWLIQEQASRQGEHSKHGQTSRIAALSMSLAATLAGIPLLRVAQALYFHFAAKLLTVGLGFRHWLSLACWSNLPLFVPLPAFVLALVVHPNRQVSQQALEVFSLNNLLFHVEPNDPLYQVFTTLTVLHPWAWWLAALGIKEWGGLSWACALFVVLLPKVVIYGGWAASILF